ncbi:radical SAM protein, partial [Candidatus Sumerlaeota bacterium]|nr:radical SAM protein [Candidatus Sumerlaeota bacterium]
MTSPLIAPNPGGAVSGQPATLLINEIYASIQGESTYAGRPCVFIRLTGCPLRCVWCDTAYAFTGGDRLTLDEILDRTRSFGIGLVEVTGGEPLAQPECIPLLAALCDSGFEVLLETGGSMNISSVDPRVIKIMDIKCPGSGEEKSNRWENLKLLQPHDEIKFVIRDRADFDWAIRVIRELTE